MCEIWGANCLLSGMRDRRGMFFPGARFQDLFDLCEREVALFLTIIKMGRNAHPGLGPIVDEDLPREEFAANLVRVWTFDGNGSCALCGLFRGVHTPAARLRSFNQSRRHSNRLFADRGNTNFIENVQSGPAGVQRRDMRRAVQIAKGIFAGVNRAGFECEWPPMCDPSGQRGAQFRPQIFAHVEVSNARAATEPFQNAAHRKIHTQASIVERAHRVGAHVILDAWAPTRWARSTIARVSTINELRNKTCE